MGPASETTAGKGERRGANAIAATCLTAGGREQRGARLWIGAVL
jgi:hypothetical protein